MQVSVGVFRQYVVEHNIATFDVHSTAIQICGYQKSLLEVLELLVPGDKQHHKKSNVLVTSFPPINL